MLVTQHYKNEILNNIYYCIRNYRINVYGFLSNISVFEMYKILINVIHMHDDFLRNYLYINNEKILDIKIYITELGDLCGEYDSKTNSIYINSALTSDLESTLLHELVHFSTSKIIDYLDSEWGPYIKEGIAVFAERLYFPNSDLSGWNDWSLIMDRVDIKEHHVFSGGFYLLLAHFTEIIQTLNGDLNVNELDSIISDFFESEVKVFERFKKRNIDFIIFDNKTLYRWGIVYDKEIIETPKVTRIDDCELHNFIDLPIYFVNSIDKSFYKLKDWECIYYEHYEFLSDLYKEYLLNNDPVNKKNSGSNEIIVDCMGSKVNIKHNSFFEEFYRELYQIKKVVLEG